MEKWEYHTEPLYFVNPVMMDETLNRLGNDGWELMSVVQCSGRDDTILLIYKRRVEPE